MSERFENELKNALRPVDPGEDFTASVMQRLEGSPGPSARSARDSRRFAPKWLGVGLAASVIAAVGLVQVQQNREREEGLRARQQLLDALHVTSEKLNLAYRVVQVENTIEIDGNAEDSRPEPDGDGGGV